MHGAAAHTCYIISQDTSGFSRRTPSMKVLEISPDHISSQPTTKHGVFGSPAHNATRRHIITKSPSKKKSPSSPAGSPHRAPADFYGDTTANEVATGIRAPALLWQLVAADIAKRPRPFSVKSFQSSSLHFPTSASNTATIARNFSSAVPQPAGKLGYSNYMDGYVDVLNGQSPPSVYGFSDTPTSSETPEYAKLPTLDLSPTFKPEYAVMPEFDIMQLYMESAMTPGHVRNPLFVDDTKTENNCMYAQIDQLHAGQNNAHYHNANQSQDATNISYRDGIANAKYCRTSENLSRSEINEGNSYNHLDHSREGRSNSHYKTESSLMEHIDASRGFTNENYCCTSENLYSELYEVNIYNQLDHSREGRNNSHNETESSLIATMNIFSPTLLNTPQAAKNDNYQLGNILRDSNDHKFDAPEHLYSQLEDDNVYNQLDHLRGGQDNSHYKAFGFMAADGPKTKPTSAQLLNTPKTDFRVDGREFSVMTPLSNVKPLIVVSGPCRIWRSKVFILLAFILVIGGIVGLVIWQTQHLSSTMAPSIINMTVSISTPEATTSSIAEFFDATTENLDDPGGDQQWV